MKKILFVTFMLLISLIPKVKSQSNIETRNEERFKISPLSPNSASLGIFGHTPVGHYTGIPNISVPLYEIDLDGKKIPIAISYHSSGIRVAQESSSIGLGWALNIGGAITKTINGEDDFVAVNNAFPSYYTDILNMSEVHNDLFNMERGAIQAKYYKYISEGGKGEPDVFHYNFLGFSGKFVFDKIGTTYKGHTNTSTSAKAVLIDPQQQLDILFNPVTKVWTIKDLEGYTYGFEQIESSTTFMLSSSARLPYNEATLKQQTFQTKGPIETAYCLTYIESPQKNRITFTYGAEYLQTPISLDERIYYSNAPDLLSYTRYVGGLMG